MGTDIYKNEGIMAFYKGYLAALVLCSHGIIKMVLYEYSKMLMEKLNITGNIGSFISGTVSQILTSSLLYPLTTVRFRQQQKQYVMDGHFNIVYEGFMKTIKTIYVHQGIKGFYRGLMLQIVKLGPSFGLFFMIYEGMNKRLLLKFNR